MLAEMTPKDECVNAYECVNRRIRNIVLDYQNRDIIDYLRGLAHNMMH